MIYRDRHFTGGSQRYVIQRYALSLSSSPSSTIASFVGHYLALLLYRIVPFDFASHLTHLLRDLEFRHCLG